MPYKYANNVDLFFFPFFFFLQQKPFEKVLEKNGTPLKVLTMKACIEFFNLKN